MSPRFFAIAIWLSRWRVSVSQHVNPTKLKNQANMKNRQLLIDLLKRTAGVVAAVAMFATPSGFTFAARSGTERQKSEHAIQRLRHIIAIYQENWSFDSLYGQFPGANGLQQGFVTCPQSDKAANQ